jgi:hypothetical protein
VLLSQPATRAISVGLNRPPSEPELASRLPAPESDPAPPLDPEAPPELDPELLAFDPELDPEEPLDPEVAPELPPVLAIPELPVPELPVLDPDPELELGLDDALCAVPPEDEEHPASARGPRATAHHTAN